MRTNALITRPAGLRPQHRLAGSVLRICMIVAVAVTLTLTTTGCDSDDDTVAGPNTGNNGNNGGDTATFSVTVSGAESFTATGSSAFAGGTAAEGGWDLQLLAFGDEGPLNRLEIVGDGDRPAVGDYTIVSVAEQAELNQFYARFDVRNNELYSSTTGTLSITASSETLVSGTFSFDAEDTEAEAVSAQGSFQVPNIN